MSDWKPFYRELAVQLIEYEQQQPALLSFLEDLRAAGRTITPLLDEDAQGNRFLLEAIDPFTVFGVFNRGIKDDERARIAEAYRQFFSVDTPAPSDFTGVPVLHNLRSWFLRFAHKRGEGDVAALWKLFRVAQLPDPFDNSEFQQVFAEVLNLAGININITLGLYWVQPSAFIPLDVATRNTLGIAAPKRVTPVYYEELVRGTFAERAKYDQFMNKS